MTQKMIVVSTNHPSLRFPNGDALRTIRRVYRGEQKELPALAIVFTHNRYMRKINRKFLSHNYDTDVIAFPLGADGGVEGEIYINLDAARKQSREYENTFTQEVRRLLIHGALHLIGYTDRSIKKKGKMHERENWYLNILEKNA